jgi:hypothetical protein
MKIPRLGHYVLADTISLEGLGILSGSQPLQAH